ncbi:SMP-30/gluconolactonase/LRE family protein [Hymenobacter siberiensis]|jgi:sugar lactone lactonase YvrE|uniref:SMP-30/gluconolactonase/LRE family protein n=1 Tax=Hymenobacter siberiensis TaxID=2848396 RepID=UPI001C1DF7C1|nr:SMP-30/gluconolactonase/LRE family protein [Hymenobacter siberiensis]MBU6123005.1 SMP-30/gluconolactonase/LRE family protein [Hymenobacter siberiensis]
MQAESILHAQAALGEGAIWNPETAELYWVDIEGRALHVFDPATGHDRPYPVGRRIGTVVPRCSGRALVALQTGIHEIDLATGLLTRLAHPLTDEHLRFNDGKCDPAGRLWVGTFDMLLRPHAGTLYRFDPDGSTHVMLPRITNSNGIAWSSDRTTMYYIDTPTLAVQAFDYDNATGSIANSRVVVRFAEAEGWPDGMTIDAEGKLWVALWGGGRVQRYDPGTGALLQVVAVPAPFTSSCAFGGSGLETLFITSARGGLTPQQAATFPLSGDVFAVRPGVAGVPACFFGE